jgi:hypothetical protein
MAGDWIKIENVTPDKPEIDILADSLGISVNEVIGALVRMWIWADQQTLNGNAHNVTKSAIDRHSGVNGLSDALLLPSVHWLEKCENGGFQFPNFERHNGKTAKTRALTSKRVASHKKRKGNAKVTPGALPREEKRREDNNNSARKRSEPFKPPTLMEVAAYCSERKNGIDPQAFLDHYDACGWRYGSGNGKPLRDWKAAVRTWENRRKETISQEEPYV